MTEENGNEYQVCYKHHDRKTYLRCNKCGRPICLECAVQTPTGYRCKECIKAQQQVFNTSEKKDYVIGAVIAAVLGFIGGYIWKWIPFMSFLAAVIIGGLFGKLICTAVRSAVGKRRSDLLNKVVIAAAAAGALIGQLQDIILFVNLITFGHAGIIFSSLTSILLDLLYTAVLCTTIRSDMFGMVFRR